MRQGRATSLNYPDSEQAAAFHAQLGLRLGAEEWGPLDENKLRASLDRAKSTVQQGGQGDILTIAAFMLFGLIRDEPFGKGNTEAGLCLTLAFLLRHGIAIGADPEELAGISLAIQDGQVFAAMIEQWLRAYTSPADY